MLVVSCDHLGNLLSEGVFEILYKVSTLEQFSSSENMVSMLLRGLRVQCVLTLEITLPVMCVKLLRVLRVLRMVTDMTIS